MRSREKGGNIKCDSWQSLDNVMEQSRTTQELGYWEETLKVHYEAYW